MFIINITYVNLPPKIEPKLLQAHLEFLENYFAAGVFLFSGRKTPYEGGIIIANGNDRQLIEKIINEDPLNQPELARYEIIEFEASRVNLESYQK
jgi:uncharacterized protein YciI